jgi:hypothetical protein
VRPTRLRFAAVALATLGAALASSAWAAAPIPAPRPPQNPFLAANPYSNIHDDTWMTDAYRGAGPTRPPFATRLGPLPPSICSAMTFDRRGRMLTVCPSSVAAPVLRLIDPRTLAVRASITLPAGGPPPAGTPAYQNFTGGGYFFLDQRDRVWSATKTNHLWVIAANRSGTALHRVADYDLTKAVHGQERITSALPDFTGRIWFVTKKHGKVGTLDTRTRRVRVFRTGEEIENSFAVGRGGVYIGSDRHMYRFGADARARPRVAWKVRYRNSGIHKPSQVDAGSGTTPTLLRGGYVAITDNADPMNVVVYRTALHPRRRRVVCQVPVFARGGSATENSLLGSGRSLIVENNYGYVDPFLSGPPPLTRAGFARVDIARNGTGCRRVWTNSTERGPSVVPKLSTRTQLVYTYTQEAGPLDTRVWSWVGVSARTGRRVFRRPVGEGLPANNNYAGITLGPDGTAYLGTIGGIRSLRDAR